ncbi:MAG TPA: guanitoxin biosynthesis heme-dependent pre-guanitoxin N-hydroxylase GntA [Chthoniobacterales bacterium]|jgi:hypothetical protein
MFRREAEAAFREFVMRQEYPCVGARAALNGDTYVLRAYKELGASETSAELSRDLYAFANSKLREESEYASFIAVFREPLVPNELEFEQLLWQQLRGLHELDAQRFAWDAGVSSDPADPQFSFSFAAQAFYVIGMHPNSSRLARRFPWPALVFNPHEQFEHLRADGKWKRMQETIRERDVTLQGSINPMLSDFGQSSEARQYSGRAVEGDWQAPFAAKPAKCPFHH